MQVTLYTFELSETETGVASPFCECNHIERKMRKKHHTVQLLIFNDVRIYIFCDFFSFV